jgi:alpha/beta superfamily hydrolase
MPAEPRTLVAADGTRLEAEVHVPADARAVAVLAHPHPLYGGSMHDGVPDILFQALPPLGIGALRFNFRGVQGSEGNHDEGRAERLDVLAAVAELAAARPAGVPLVVAGWSFGADVSLAVDDPVIAGWCPIAPPLRVVPPAEMPAGADARPKLVLSPEHDQFNPPASAREKTASWANTEVRAVPGADHFLWGHGQILVDAVTQFVDRLTAGPAR